MSFDRSADAAGSAGRPLPSNQRRTFLEVLHQVIGETQAGVRSGLVIRRGIPVLFVVNRVNVAYFGDVGCDFHAGSGWTFMWAEDGRPLGPVKDAAGVASVIARELRANSGTPR